MTLFQSLMGRPFLKKESETAAGSFSPSGATRPSLAFLYVFASFVSERSVFKFIGYVTLRGVG